MLEIFLWALDVVARIVCVSALCFVTGSGPVVLYVLIEITRQRR